MLHIQETKSSNVWVKELSHDFSLKRLDPQKIHQVKSLFDISLAYQFHHENQTKTFVQYYLAKPWRLRFYEFFKDTMEFDFDRRSIDSVEIDHQQFRIKFKRIRRHHQGVYSLYRFYFEKPKNFDRNYHRHENGYDQHRNFGFDLGRLNHRNSFQFTYNQNDLPLLYDNDHGDAIRSIPEQSRLINITRIDFNLVIYGLKKRNEFCRDETECESGSCPAFSCVCDHQQPIHIDGLRSNEIEGGDDGDNDEDGFFRSDIHKDHCLEASSLNESCWTDLQCQYIGGPMAECKDYRRICLCKKPSVPIRISPDSLYQCVNYAQLNEPCLYSKQCTFLGENRYCNSSYRCDCLPGFYLDSDSKCVQPPSSVSSSLSSLQTINKNIVIFLIILSILERRFN
ncbi:hypothetical protein NH340_JMT07563 [Sarcoptes scabiei]|nr:hypothetical protein NH340_JMT07563 [Sarcoptes scabiei]